MLRTLPGVHLGVEYGLKPFQSMAYEEVPLPDGGTTLRDAPSYISSTCTIQSSDSYEYVMRVDDWRVGIMETGQRGGHLLVTASVRAWTSEDD